MSLSTLSKRRKVDVENRTFNKKWESDYLFVDFNGKPQCLVCSQVMSVMKEYNIHRHHETTAKHNDKYNSVTGEARSRLVSDIKLKLKRQKSTFFKETQIQTSSIQASYEVCMLLAKNQVSFRSADIVKQCTIKMAKAFGEEKVARNSETVSLSHQTVSRRICVMNKQLESQIRNDMEKCEYFSIALDESMDISDVSQL
jgi:hypothetical protein